MAKGKKITNALQIVELAQGRKCVIGNAVWCRHHRPAAWVIGMVFRDVMSAIKHGMWVYKK